MKRKILGIFLGIIVILSLTSCSQKEVCNNIKNDEVLYLIGDAKIKFEFEEKAKECRSSDKTTMENEETVVTNFELVNAKASTVFNNINFKNLSLEDALKLYEETATKNELIINDIDMYTTSKKDYTSYLSYNVHNTILNKDEIDEKVNKKLPLNKEFKIKIYSGMEYYYEFLEFISENEVKYHTEDACYGECDINEVYKYTYDYDMDKNRIYIDLENEYNYKYTYYIDEDKLEYGTNYD